jgi:hypothetical protein
VQTAASRGRVVPATAVNVLLRAIEPRIFIDANMLNQGRVWDGVDGQIRDKDELIYGDDSCRTNARIITAPCLDAV